MTSTKVKIQMLRNEIKVAMENLDTFYAHSKKSLKDVDESLKGLEEK